MVAHHRAGDPKREEWIFKNNTQKILAIGDLKTVPQIGPGKSLDLLNYASKEKIGQSKDLQTVLSIGWATLSKRAPGITGKNYTVPQTEVSDAVTEVSVYEAESGLVGGGSGTGGSINDLDDVNTTGIVDGQFIFWDSVAGEFVPTSSSSTVNDIGDITNVTISALADNQILQYNLSTTRWENVDYNLGNLTNVNTAGVTDGQVLTYDSGSSTYVMADPSLGSINDIDNINITGITDGQLLVYDDYTSSFLPADQSLSDLEVSNIELEGEYKVSSLSAFKELIYTGDNLTQINIWRTSSKLSKTYQKDLSYSGDQLTQTLLTRIIDSATVTKDLVYSGDNLSSIEITQA